MEQDFARTIRKRDGCRAGDGDAHPHRGAETGRRLDLGDDREGTSGHQTDPKATAEFRAAATDLIKTMRGAMVPADVFDLALAERDAYRKSKGR